MLTFLLNITKLINVCFQIVTSILTINLYNGRSTTTLIFTGVYFTRSFIKKIFSLRESNKFLQVILVIPRQSQVKSKILDLYYTALLWQNEAGEKSDNSLGKSKMCLLFTLKSLEYHDILPNISLIAWMSVSARNMTWKKSMLCKL